MINANMFERMIHMSHICYTYEALSTDSSDHFSNAIEKEGKCSACLTMAQAALRCNKSSAWHNQTSLLG